MTITLNPDPANQNLFTGLYIPLNGVEPSHIAAAYHPNYAGYNLVPLLSSSIEGTTTPGYVVTIDTTTWTSVLPSAPIEVFFVHNECWAILNVS